ncbi:transposase [Rhodococcus gordoniae]|uniref:transposase n=1 Tax=Rhodococcus gordoniae TaxID=223392 RepID=UPI003CC92068
MLLEKAWRPGPEISGERAGRLHTPQRYNRRLRRVMHTSASTAARCGSVSRAYR